MLRDCSQTLMGGGTDVNRVALKIFDPTKGGLKKITKFLVKIRLKMPFYGVYP